MFLADHPVDALAAVEKEALRRIRKHKRPLGELVLLEAGLWRERPDLCWALELRVLEKQGQDFKMCAPDEPAARAVFVREHPELVKKRHNLLESLRPTDLLIGGDDDEGAGAQPSGHRNGAPRRTSRTCAPAMRSAKLRRVTSTSGNSGMAAIIGAPGMNAGMRMHS